ncbi:MAG: tRNA (cytidine(34)-2'-O)-methyltransferase [Pseudohongiella sp.]|uniref:tRNA (cytidine(34)-2'-O)-methyltransferase n=1 Tax=Pseudohongiella sp. TaxID=1979412 RepID=UPI0034A01757
MIHIVLYQPEIPPNTGNIIRLAANTGALLHLIEPLGFDLDEKRVRRAGLDYREMSQVRRWQNWQQFVAESDVGRLLAFTTKASASYSDIHYQNGDGLLFGPETRGLPIEIRNSLPEDQRVRIPMQTNSRSLNLSNSVAIGLYEALRQTGFPGLA